MAAFLHINRPTYSQEISREPLHPPLFFQRFIFELDFPRLARSRPFPLFLSHTMRRRRAGCRSHAHHHATIAASAGVAAPEEHLGLRLSSLAGRGLCSPGVALLVQQPSRACRRYPAQSRGSPPQASFSTNCSTQSFLAILIASTPLSIFVAVQRLRFPRAVGGRWIPNRSTSHAPSLRLTRSKLGL